MSKIKLLVIVSTFFAVLGARAQESPDESTIDPLAGVDIVTVSPGGRHIRMVGVQKAASKETAATEIGDVVVATDEEIGGAICHAYLDAPLADYKDHPCGKTAAVPELQYCFGKISCPVKINSSKDMMGYYMWSVLLSAPCCIVASDLAEYVGSSTYEFLNLELSKKNRLLKTTGKCKDKENNDKEYDCIVPVGDSKEIKEADITVPHGWAGRTDLNNVKALYDETEKKHKAKSRKPEKVVVEDPEEIVP